MAIIFQLFSLIFLVAVGILLFILVMALTGGIWLKRKMFKTNENYNPFGGRGRRAERPERRRTRVRRRIIPPEYAEDVEYEVLSLTGTERFVIVEEVLAYRGEGQISEAVYTVIIN